MISSYPASDAISIETCPFTPPCALPIYAIVPSCYTSVENISSLIPRTIRHCLCNATHTTSVAAVWDIGVAATSDSTRYQIRVETVHAGLTSMSILFYVTRTPAL